MKAVRCRQISLAVTFLGRATKPNTVRYNVLFRAYLQVDQLAAAWNLRAKFTPNAYTHNALIQYDVVHDKLQTAIDYASGIKRFTPVTWARIMNGFLMRGELHKAMGISLVHGLQGNVSAENAFMSYYIRSNKID